MFLDPTTKLCLSWDDGKYMDTTLGIWRDWGTACTGLWAYQTIWFECSGNQILDLDTLTCVDEWSTLNTLLEHSQFNVAKVWRGRDYYVDPTSNGVLELGTKKFPFKTFKAVSSEILNHFSYTDINITINLKEGSQIYIEDDTTYFMELTDVKIKSYSSNSSSPMAATIVPTAISQPGILKNSAFNILANTDLNITEVIANGIFDDSYLAYLAEAQVTLKIVRTTFTLENVNVHRESVDYNTAKLFLYPIDLQTKNMTILNVDFNVTGRIAFSFDPLNFRMENIIFDSYSLIDAFYFDMK